jgi:RimJ/RimL family protein N-acetyltransferase
MNVRGLLSPVAAAPGVLTQPLTSSGWRNGLPVLAASSIVLRELELDDAPSLVTMLSTDDVTRFIAPPPATIDAMERFIVSAHAARHRGNYVCFGVVPDGMSSAVGIFELRRMDPSFGVAQWHFALGSPYWGTGMFVAGARAVVDFAMSTLGVHRLEARVAEPNGRAHASLKKLGATRECLLRDALARDHRSFDQVMWSIVDSDWVRARAHWKPRVRVH